MFEEVTVGASTNLCEHSTLQTEDGLAAAKAPAAEYKKRFPIFVTCSLSASKFVNPFLV